jgi:predicted kinase
LVDGVPLFVVVLGPPASGKSTVAPALARELRLPLVAKDTIKDSLLSVLGADDIEESRQLGRAAVSAMLAVASASPAGAVLESNFYRSAADRLRRLPGFVVEVFCRCPPEVAQARFSARAGTRDAGYFDQSRTAEELWNSAICEPVAGGWPVIEVDTTMPLDIAAIARAVRLARPAGA